MAAGEKEYDEREEVMSTSRHQVAWGVLVVVCLGLGGRGLGGEPASTNAPPAADAAAGKGSRVVKVFELRIPFDLDKTDITPESHASLDEVAQWLKDRPELTARIEGHSDQVKKSSATYSQKLTERRAQAVLQYPASKGGIAAHRLSAAGYGFSRPKEPNDLTNPSGTPANRRIEILVVAP